MRKIDLILKLCKPFLNKKQLEQLANVLESVLEPSHQNLGDDDLIIRYIDRCRMRNLSESTIANYSAKLVDLSSSCESYFLDIDTEEIEMYLSNLKNNGLSATSINNHISCFRAFFKWLTDYEYISKNPMNRIDNVKCELKLKESFSRNDIEKMREYFTHPRDRALFEFLLGSGVRISELCKLKVKDLDMTTTPYSVIVHGKGNKQRRIPISDTAVVYLCKYLDDRKPLFDEDYLFLPIRGESRMLKRNSVEQMFIRASADLGIHIHPHKFRRTYCSELVAHGMALAYAQKLMGHSTPNTTMQYTNVKDNLVFAEFQKVSNF